MKFISLYSKSTPEDLLTAVSDNNFVNENVKFADDGIKPLMKVKEKNGRLSIKCEMIGGPSKDNGFIVGTFFAGKIKECKCGSKLSGIILTAPIYHFIVFAFILWVVYRCIVDNAINILPIFILAFDIMLFGKEFKKQGYIQRYLYRAVKRSDARLREKTQENE